MKIQTLGLLTAVGALALTSAGTLASCAQPPIECTAGHGDFAVKYIPVSGDPMCNAKSPENVGFQVYNPLQNEDTCVQKGDDKICEGTAADSTKVIFGIQTLEMGLTSSNAVEPDPDAMHHVYSVGNVKEVLPDASGMCYVPTLTPAEQNLPLVPGEGGAGGTGGIPNAQEPTDVKYEWSNLKIYVTASAPGTQFEADVKYTFNGCSATFKAIGMYPAIDCSADDPATPEFETDPSVCNPNPDPDKGRAFGSGINPDFPIKCEPNEAMGFALCVLDSDKIPALKQ
jgi:hypothetical protein